jgi:xanthine phosphoribosyltransferase
MEKLKELIKTKGQNLGKGILKVDGFINHQIDTTLMFEAGQELAKRFKDTEATKVITAEISGIGPALTTGYALGIPVIYARKVRPVTMTGKVYVEVAPSHTKGSDAFLMVSSEFIREDDKFLIIDDFLASGSTIGALARLIEHANATLVGVGAVIEKSFEGGRESLKYLGVPIATLAVISKMTEDTIEVE